MTENSPSDPKLELAQELGLQTLADLSEVAISQSLLKKVSYNFAKKYGVLPWKAEGDTVTVLMSDPLALEAQEETQWLLGSDLELIIAPEEALFNLIHSTYGDQESGAASIIEGLDHNEDGEEEVSEIFDLLDDSDKTPTTKLLSAIMREAIQQKTSDIHFEPCENDLTVRYRIDGVLQKRHSPPREYQGQLLARIKVLAQMDIAERRLPQDGRIKVRFGSREVDFRASSVPIVYGERIVLRILDKGNVLMGLDQLGMPESLRKEFDRLIRLPEGIVLVTGPTGSGKTTTLYSALTELSDDETNVMTIEDPVEYKLDGIAQIAVHHKIDLTFAAGLRTILRQDPDIILVGEIRDMETAQVAIQASMTGHLVLSTLHTNDAPSAITRLIDMGEEPFLISSSLAGVLAQRLVRRICSECKESYTPTKDELDSLDLRNPPPVLYKGKGCSNCYDSGYKGRRGIYELMSMNPAIRTRMSETCDATEIRKVAIETGMVSLHQYGAMLVSQGETTIEELHRVTRNVDE